MWRRVVETVGCWGLGCWLGLVGVAAYAGPGSPSVSWPRAVGNQLLDDQGRPLRLYGVNLIDPEAADHQRPGWSAVRFVEEAVTVYHANILRLAVHPDGVEAMPGWFADPDHYFAAHLQPAIARAVELGAYVIIDLHYVANYDATLREQRVLPFWRALAPRYAHVPNVIFDLFNEPVAPDNWATWKTVMAQPVVDAIRATGATRNLIIVGGPQYCQHMAGAATNPIDDANVAYSAHFYPGHQPWRDVNYPAALLASRVVLMEEWGYNANSTWPHLVGTTSGFGVPLLNWLDAKGLNWLVWTFDNSWEPWMFNPNWTLTSGEAGMGEFVRDSLASHAPPALTLTLSQGRIGEGAGAGALTGRVARNTATAAPLAVALASSRPGAADLPPAVMIPAGAGWVDVAVTLTDNVVAAGPVLVTFEATAAGHREGRTDLVVTDDETRLVYVDARATGANDGTSWANAYTDLRTALLTGVAGDEFWVAAGTYRPTTGTDRSVNFPVLPGVGVYGGFAGWEDVRWQRDWARHVTTLNGDLGVPGDATDNTATVVTLLGPGAVLDGVTVSGAYVETNLGAGASLSSGTLRHCTFTGNQALRGSDVYLLGPATLDNCHFRSTAGPSQVYIVQSAPTLTNCDFSGAGARSLWLEEASPTITRCRFTQADGDAVWCNWRCRPVFTDCHFAGARFFCRTECEPRFTNCTFVAAGALSTALEIESRSRGVIVHCSTYGFDRGIGFADQSGGEVHGAVIWGNWLYAISASDPTLVTVADSCVKGGYVGTGNLATDPQFVDAAGGNLRLQPGSPCVNAGVPSANTPAADQDGSPRDGRPDLGAFEGAWLVNPSAETGPGTTPDGWTAFGPAAAEWAAGDAAGGWRSLALVSHGGAAGWLGTAIALAPPYPHGLDLAGWGATRNVSATAAYCGLGFELTFLDGSTLWEYGSLGLAAGDQDWTMLSRTVEYAQPITQVRPAAFLTGGAGEQRAHFDRLALTPRPAVAVASEPPGVEVSGTWAGPTPLAGTRPLLSEASFTVPATLLRAGEPYRFRCWELDGVRQARDQTTITLRVTANHTLRALYDWQQGPNVVANPGMEGGTDAPASWASFGTAAASWATDAAHRGTRALKLVGDGSNSGWRGEEVALPDPWPYTITFSGWSRATAVAGATNYTLAFTLTFADGTTSSYTTGLGFSAGTHGWESRTRTATFSQPVKAVQPFALLHGGAGTVWFDDLAATPQPTVTRNFMADDAALPGAAAPADWFAFGGGGSWATDQKRTGSRSLKLVCAAQNAGWWNTPFNFPEPYPHRLAIRGWSRAEGVTASAYKLILYLVHADNSVEWWDDGLRFAAGTHDWQEVARQMTWPTGIKQARLYCLLYGTGTAWFDDLEVIPSAPRQANFNMETGTPGVGPTDWLTYNQALTRAAAWDTADPHNGTRALKLVNPTGANAGWVASPASFGEPYPTSLVLGGWAKGWLVAADSTAFGFAYYVTLGDGSTTWHQPAALAFDRLVGGWRWRETVAYFPQGVRQIRPYALLYGGSGTQTAWFDDVYVLRHEPLNRNADLETGEAALGPYYWGTGGQELTRASGWATDAARSGRHSLKLVNRTGSNAYWSSVKLGFGAPYPRQFTVRASAKADHVASAALFTLAFHVEFADGTTATSCGAYNATTRRYDLYLTPGTHDWLTLQQRLTFTKDVQSLTPLLLLYRGSGEQTAWFDDIHVSPE